jgi:dTDP-4-amino-4,6-dideoxygalactose transaminase
VSSGGPALGQFEAGVQAYLDADGISSASSGKAALTTTLQAMATLRRGRTVAIPAYTCYSVPAAIVRAGLDIALIDVDPVTFDFDEASLARVMARTDLLCVMPTHLFGIAADVDRIRKFVGRDVWILEDAAQALGVRDAEGRLLGTRGDAALFSLGRGKHLTCGAGGFIATRSAELTRVCTQHFAALPAAPLAGEVKKLAELAVMGVFLRPELYWFPAGLPFLGLGETVYSTEFSITRLPAVGAGILREWRRRLERSNARRQQHVATLTASITQGRARVSGPLLRFPVLARECRDRDALLAAGRRLGVTRMYPGPIHEIAELRSRFPGQRFPGAEALAETLVTLPTHPLVAASDLAALADLCTDRVAVPRMPIAERRPLPC